MASANLQYPDPEASGRYGSGQLPDLAFDAENKPEAIKEAQMLAGLIAHPWAGNDTYI